MTDNHKTFLSAIVVLTAFVLLLSPPAGAALTTSTWVGGTGDWSDPLNWAPQVVPDNVSTDHYDVRIDGGDTGTDSAVTLDMGASMDNLTIDAGDMLTMADGQSLTVKWGTESGSIHNAGTLQVGSTGADTILIVSGGPVALDGGGTVLMSDDASNIVRATSGLYRLTNHDNLIQGSGQFGQNVMALTNLGTIDANQATALIIDPSSTGAANAGILQASGVGTLRLLNGSFDNTGGTIQGVAGGIVETSNVTITGGTLDSSGGGAVRPDFTTFQNVANAGTLDIADGNRATLLGALNNTGNVQLSGATTGTLLILSGDVTLSGGGTVTLSDSDQNFIYGQAGTERLTNLDNTIQGAGQLGQTRTALTNAGTIDANEPTVLIVDPSAVGAINTGTMRASAGGTLLLQGGSFTNTDGLIEADGGTVRIYSATVSGGTLTTRNGGHLNPELATLENVTNTGTVELLNGKAATLLGAIANTGTIQLADGASGATLSLAGTEVTLTGGGAVTLGTGTGNVIRGAGGANVLTNQDNTISGAGHLGQNDLVLANAGLVLADQSNALIVDPNGTATNTGTLRATGSGVLQLGPAVYNSSGQVLADAGGTVNVLSGAELVNTATVQIGAASLMTVAGTYRQTAGTTTVDGTMALTGGTFDFQAGTLAGSGQVSGNVVVPGGGHVAPGSSPDTLTIAGNLTFADGAIYDYEAADPTSDLLAVSGAVTFDGAVTVNVTDYDGSFTAGDLVLVGGYASTAGAPTWTINLPVGWLYDAVIIDTLSVRLTNVSGGRHPGDANEDGIVDLQDFGVLKVNFGTTTGATWGMADFNSDDAIDLQDFGILKLHFGHTAGDPLSAVPEPATLSLLAIGGLAVLRSRRK